MGQCVCALSDTTNVQDTDENKKQDQLDATPTPTTANAVELTDEIDEFIETIRESTNDHSFIALFIAWIKCEQYDWDSILNDIDCNIDGKGSQHNQSNIYSFFVRQNQKYPNIFDLLREKYIDDTEEHMKEDQSDSKQNEIAKYKEIKSEEILEENDINETDLNEKVAMTEMIRDYLWNAM
eukprot:14619_1